MRALAEILGIIKALVELFFKVNLPSLCVDEVLHLYEKLVYVGMRLKLRHKLR
jgi:hypothetical protein